MSTSEQPNTRDAFALYDQYCHGDIDRRTFIERAGGASVVAALGLMPNYARAATVATDDPGIIVDTITYASPAGAGVMGGLLVRPATGAPAPSVLVIHENRGLNPYIADVARRLGKAGYMAFAPDALFPLGGYPGDDDTGRALQAQRSRDEMLEDFIAGAAYLKAHAAGTGAVGAVGFCFGGAMANMLAVRVPDLRAAVPYYGGWPSAAEAADVRAPLLIHLAGLDERVNAGWPAYKDALDAAGKTYTAHVYEGAQHGFHNDTTPRLDAAAAALSWERTLGFFAANLV